MSKDKIAFFRSEYLHAERPVKIKTHCSAIFCNISHNIQQIERTQIFDIITMCYNFYLLFAKIHKTLKMPAKTKWKKENQIKTKGNRLTIIKNEKSKSTNRSYHNELKFQNLSVFQQLFSALWNNCNEGIFPISFL